MTTHSACSSIQARSGYTPIHTDLAFETDDRYGKMYVWLLVTIHHWANWFLCRIICNYNQNFGLQGGSSGVRGKEDKKAGRRGCYLDI